MQKLLFFILFILFNSIAFSQNFSFSAKYSTQIHEDLYRNNSGYWSYKALTIEGLFSIWDNKIKFGPNLGFTYSGLPFATTIPEYSQSEQANVWKNHLGGAIYFFPLESTYSPFIGVKGDILIDCLFSSSQKKDIFHSGFYNYRTTNDYLYSLLGGIIIEKNKIGFILELEYQQRHLVLEYDEYEYMTRIHTHSVIMDIATLNFGIGLQYVF